MENAVLEHVNFTVADPERTAKMLTEIFGWHVRWKGDSIHGGVSYHVGTQDSYVAIYSKGAREPAPESYSHVGGLNHIGVVVDDLSAVEHRVIKAGFKTHSHADYEPGRRFYFHDSDGMEFEVISYDD